MKQTVGIVIDAGAGEDYIQNPYYDNKLKVRVPELHGHGPIAVGFKEKDKTYTQDKDIPWATIVCASLSLDHKYSALTYKAQHFSVGDAVYVQYEEENLQITVIGSKTRYVEGETVYNGLDVTDLVESADKFPDTLTQTSTSSSTSISTTEKDSSAGSGLPSSTSIKNKTKWKTIFGNPFRNKSNYTISAGFPHYPRGGNHSGLDLAGPSGTPIYAAGNGTVCRVNSMGSAFGNHVVIDHGVVNGIHLYTLYGHMVSKPLVRVGQKVKGTQLAAPDWKKNTYYSGQRGRDDKLSNPQLVTSKPKDWSTSYIRYYIKSGSDYESVKAVPQKGSQIGRRGSTGNSTGPHLHFMVTDNLNYVSNRQVGSGHIKDPRDFITF